MVSGMEVLRYVLNDIVDLSEVHPYATIFDDEGHHTFKFMYENDAVRAGQIVNGKRAFRNVERRGINLEKVEGFAKYRRENNLELCDVANNLDQILDQFGIENKGPNKMVVDITEEYDCSSGEGMRYATKRIGTFLTQRSAVEKFFRDSEEGFHTKGTPHSRFFISNGFGNFTFPKLYGSKVTGSYQLTFEETLTEKGSVDEFIDSAISSVDKGYTLVRALRLNKDRLSELGELYRELMSKKK